jgi:proteic killer suppression protein
MIRTFRCKDAEAIFHLEGSRKFRNIEQAAYRRIVMLDGAQTLADLAALRSNRLEPLRGNRAGAIQHSRQRPMAHLFCMAGK